MPNIFTSLKSLADDARKAIFTPAATATAPAAPQALPQEKGYSSVDTLSSSDVSLIETKLSQVSLEIENELQKGERDFEKLQTLVYNIIMLTMRNSAKADHEYINEMADQIKVHSIKIKDTYNTWSGVTVTVISAAISFAGGASGLTPFLPSSIIAADTAAKLAQNAQALATAGTGVGSIGSLLSSRQEGERGVYQIELKTIETKKDHREEAKRSNNEARKAARAAQDEFTRMRHETAKTVASAA